MSVSHDRHVKNLQGTSHQKPQNKPYILDYNKFTKFQDDNSTNNNRNTINLKTHQHIINVTDSQQKITAHILSQNV